MNELKVDNSHFRKFFFQIDCIIAIFLLMMETVYFLIWWKLSCEDFTVLPQHLLIYLVLPSILNLLILFGVVLIQKYAVKKESMQNYAVIVALVLMVLITIFLYRQLSCAVCLFVLPIFMTTAFRDRKMTHQITASAVIGCLAYTAVTYLMAGDEINLIDLFPNAAIALVMMILADMLVMMLLEIMVLLFVSDIQKIADSLEQDMAKAVQDVMGSGKDKSAEGGSSAEAGSDGKSDAAEKSGGKTGADGESDGAGKSGAAGETDETGKSGATGETDETGKSGAAGGTDETGKSGAAGGTDETGKPGAAGETDKTEKPGAADGTGADGKSGAAEKTGAGAQSGTSGESGDDAASDSASAGVGASNDPSVGKVAATTIEEEEVELSPDEKKLRQLIVQIPQIDSKKGIAYCANDEHLYLEILKDFATNSALRQLTELQQKGSWGNYQIGVRVLKNTSESLGFPELSRHTGELDQAAQREDYDYIRAHHGEIITEYLQIAEKIMSIVK